MPSLNYVLNDLIINANIFKKLATIYSIERIIFKYTTWILGLFFYFFKIIVKVLRFIGIVLRFIEFFWGWLGNRNFGKVLRFKKKVLRFSEKVLRFNEILLLLLLFNFDCKLYYLYFYFWLLSFINLKWMILNLTIKLIFYYKFLSFLT